MGVLENGKTIVQNELDKPSGELPANLEYAAKVLDAFEIARFWSRVEVRKANQCWPWRWGSSPDGYGEHRLLDGNSSTAHRVAYRIGNGDIERGLVIRHTCDNPLCCNPAHLINGTHADNVADRVERGRSAIGEASGRAKLTEKDVLAMRASPLSNAYWARRLRVDTTSVAAARSGKTWAHLPQ
jgi:hypothetical protein